MRWAKRFGTAAATGAALFLGASLPAAADTIRLIDGTVLEGHIVRNDDTAVIIVVRGQPQFFPADDISAILYNESFVSVRVSPRTGRVASHLTNVSVVQKIRERMLTFHGFVTRVSAAAEYLRWGDFRRAGRAFQRAAQWILPMHRGEFNPFSALADLLILLGLRAPAVWLALALVRQQRQFLRIAEFFVPSYGFLMLLMLYATTAPSVWVQVFLFPLAIAGVGLLFIWMFALTRGRALLAFLLTIAMNVSIEALLVHQGWLTAQSASAMQVAFR